MNNAFSSQRKKSSPWVPRFLGVFFVLVIGLGIGAYLYYTQQLTPRDPKGELQAFVVKDGESTAEIVQRLEAEKLIRSALALKIYLRQQGTGVTIEAGDFKLSPAMSVSEILENLSQGAVDKWVRLLEGWRVEQMAQEVKKSLGIEEPLFLQAASSEEGYLFPDTYLFNPEAVPADIVSVLKNTFDKRYTPDLQAKIQSHGLTPEEGVILASIVEREARSKKIRTEVAGILMRRFKEGMALQADATVQYAKDSQTLKAKGTLEKFWQPISQSEYRSIVSPYNTYLNAGLPPAPICNPSLSSLEAVAEADPDTEYLFYLHDSEGNTYYAHDYNEHQKNIEKYL